MSMMRINNVKNVFACLTVFWEWTLFIYSSVLTVAFKIKSQRKIQLEKEAVLSLYPRTKHPVLSTVRKTRWVLTDQFFLFLDLDMNNIFVGYYTKIIYTQLMREKKITNVTFIIFQLQYVKLQVVCFILLFECFPAISHTKTTKTMT